MNLKNWMGNVTLAGLFGIIVVVIAYMALGWFTNHGENINMPNLKGVKTEQAMATLKNLELRTMVIDSVYNGDLNKNTIAKQDPAAGTNVKEGRIVYLTINSLEEPKASVPQLVDKSFTLGRALLKSRGLSLGQVMYVYDSIGHNLILEQRFEGSTIETGAKLSKGSSIDLVITTNRESLVKKDDSTGLVMQKDSLGNLMDTEFKKRMEQLRKMKELGSEKSSLPSTAGN
ncbi:PASTA domain-containing protein [Bacteroidia bacterium]|nr:PASTA domain-containing protein [Bacteroidia bacterium]